MQMGGKYPNKYSYFESSEGTEAWVLQWGVLNSVIYFAKRYLFVVEHYYLDFKHRSEKILSLPV